VDEASARMLEATAIDGVFHVADAEALGINKHHRRQAAVTGRWRRVAEQTWVVTAHHASAAQPMIAALVAARGQGVATDLGAATLRGWDCQPTVRLAVGARKGHKPGGVHRSQFDPQQVDEVHGFRCMTAIATLASLAVLLDDDEWEQALESALRSKEVTFEEVAGLVGRAGSGGRIERVLERRGDVRPTRSWLETKVVQLCRTRTDIPEPERGFEIWDRGRFVAEVDLSWVALEGYLECDGRAFHTRDAQFVADRWRETQIVSLLGWPRACVTTANLATPQTTARKLAEFIATLQRRRRSFGLTQSSGLLIPAGEGRPARLWTSSAPSTRPAS
jgi:hypothetical protein